MNARERVAELLGGALLDALDEYIDQRVADALAELPQANSTDRDWLTLEEAGQQLGCSADAVRMRVKRGRLESRCSGRRVYVSRADVDRLP